MPTLLNVLTRPNPEITEMLHDGGSLTTHRRYPIVSGLEEWSDFSYNNLMTMFGHILNAELPRDIPEPPEPRGINKEDWGEGSEKWFFTNTLFPVFLSRKYRNLCPGDFKVATKWNPEVEVTNFNRYKQPFQQIQHYGAQTQARYGFIITPREVVICHFRTEKIETGIGAHRPRREPTTPPTRAHMRNWSDVTDLSPISSGVDRMSLSGTSYNEDMADVEFAPLKRMHIPYSANGPDKLTVRLALWGICMLAAALGVCTDLQSHYDYDLHSCMRTQGGFLHLSTGAVTPQPPEGAQLVEGPRPTVIQAQDHSFLADAAARDQSGSNLLITLRDFTRPDTK
ncbi:hypothetical protein P170DRAFT_447594 [Aspergillus steynii IBT 23096]|uniref:Uncharacterized protein n=1 Tax=Aspergillus steynii IBT 23096 TaxID=1392250 RepID=A0A2I2G456_9EURO|nr:uncharacterized protein P170DRAFT_447594 [Aspergillus steynii IBT 23096]PLB47664.1 hypothetical protein P170DRAFT_447594 [Aspergillus steynii IBT 23096]